MAEQLTTEKLKMGHLLPVKNTAPKLNASQVYYNLKIEDEDGSNERVLLVTPGSVKRLKKFKLGAWGSMMKPGRLYEFSRCDHKDRCFIMLVYEGEQALVVRMGEWYIREGEYRAKANPEDIVEQGFLSDALD